MQQEHHSEPGVRAGRGRAQPVPDAEGGVRDAGHRWKIQEKDIGGVVRW